MADEVLSLIAHHDDHTLQLKRRELSEQAVNQRCAVYRHHALCVVAGVFS